MENQRGDEGIQVRNSDGPAAGIGTPLVPILPLGHMPGCQDQVRRASLAQAPLERPGAAEAASVPDPASLPPSCAGITSPPAPAQISTGQLTTSRARMALIRLLYVNHRCRIRKPAASRKLTTAEESNWQDRERDRSHGGCWTAGPVNREGPERALAWHAHAPRFNPQQLQL